MSRRKSNDSLSQKKTKYRADKREKSFRFSFLRFRCCCSLSFQMYSFYMCLINIYLHLCAHNCFFFASFWTIWIACAHFGCPIFPDQRIWSQSECKKKNAILCNKKISVHYLSFYFQFKWNEIESVFLANCTKLHISCLFDFLFRSIFLISIESKWFSILWATIVLFYQIDFRPFFLGLSLLEREKALQTKRNNCKLI